MPTLPFHPNVIDLKQLLRKLGWILIPMGLILAGLALLRSLVVRGDTVEVSGVPAGDAKWLLLDTPGAESGCLVDHAVVIQEAKATLENIRVECPSELSLFSVGFAAVLKWKPGWTDGTDHVSVALDPAWQVHLNVGVAGDEAARQQAEADIALAHAYYRDKRTGLDIAVDGDVWSIESDMQEFTAVTTESCSSVTSAVWGTQALYLSLRLNVYFVSEEAWHLGEGRYGYTCKDEGLPNVIFVRAARAPITLAHEIGHSMHLAHELLGDNLMATYGYLPPTENSPPAPVRELTLGQAFRINFDEASWLNTDGPRTSLPTKACDAETAESKCPKRLLEWPVP